MALKLSDFVGLAVTPPLMSKDSFATWQGVTEDTVRGWIEQRTIPSVKMGRQRLVNVALIYRDLANGKTIFNAGDYQDDC